MKCRGGVLRNIYSSMYKFSPLFLHTNRYTPPLDLVLDFVIGAILRTINKLSFISAISPYASKQKNKNT